MTASLAPDLHPPGASEHQQTPTGLRSGDAFREACERWDYLSLQEVLRPMSKKDAVAYLLWLFPHRTRSWFERNFAYLMGLTPDEMRRVIVYLDPTGEEATAHVMAERSAA